MRRTFLNQHKLEIHGKVGLYVHIPFCRRLCPYCDFTVAVGKNPDEKQQYAAALVRELNEYAGCDLEIETIYFGGGTPSAAAWIVDAALEAIFKNFKLAESVEITIEANPEDRKDECFLSLLKNIRPRLSIGAQSLNHAVLKALGRSHGPRDVLTLLQSAHGLGVNNINIDIIFGVPARLLKQSGLDPKAAVRRIGVEIDQVAELVKHFSFYLLTVEAGSHFHEIGIKESFRRTEFEAIFHAMQKHGFTWYEVSNFARPGYECRHNIKYWRLENVIGVGVGAVSFINTDSAAVRVFNTKDMKMYLSGEKAVFLERIQQSELRREELILKMRSHQGLNYSDWQHDLKVSEMIKQGLLRLEDQKIFISPAGLFQTNNIIRYFLKNLDSRGCPVNVS